VVRSKGNSIGAPTVCSTGHSSGPPRVCTKSSSRVDPLYVSAVFSLVSSLRLFICMSLCRQSKVQRCWGAMRRGNGALKQEIYKIEKAAMKGRSVRNDSVHCALEPRIHENCNYVRNRHHAKGQLHTHTNAHAQDPRTRSRMRWHLHG